MASGAAVSSHRPTCSWARLRCFWRPKEKRLLNGLDATPGFPYLKRHKATLWHEKGVAWTLGFPLVICLVYPCVLALTVYALIAAGLRAIYDVLEAVWREVVGAFRDMRVWSLQVLQSGRTPAHSSADDDDPVIVDDSDSTDDLD